MPCSVLLLRQHKVADFILVMLASGGIEKMPTLCPAIAEIEEALVKRDRWSISPERRSIQPSLQLKAMIKPAA